MLKQPNASQLVRGMRLHMETRDLPPPCWQPAQLRQLSPECRHRGRWLSVCWCIGILPQLCATRRRIISLEDRINGCFRRSMNGKPLPVDSADMKAMVAYFDWMKGATKPEDKVPGRGWARSTARSRPTR